MIDEEIKYPFEDEFQSKIVACCLKSKKFNLRTHGLISPKYFDRESEAALVNIISRYYGTYGELPSNAALSNLIKEDVAAKILRNDAVADVIKTIRSLREEDITDEAYIVDQVARFARHRAMESAILDYAELIEKGSYDKAAKVISDASAVSANDDNTSYDFFGEKEIEDREKRRNDRLKGITSSDIVGTGVKKLDDALYHKGWAKKELYVMMGAAKAGKSISLAYFTKNAVVAGKNVLFVTLEVSKEITAERIDSSLTGLVMSKIEHHSVEAKEKIERLRDRSGRLIIEEFPTGTLTPNMLSRVIQKHKDNGIVFDMVTVDYADIMRPNDKTDEPIENSKSIYIDLRAMAQVENVVMLSAMQTNREGAKVATAKMEHAAEDFNKIRIPDLVISINRTDEEKAANKARLFFAASRNQEGDFALGIDQKLESMQFIVRAYSV